MKRILIFSHAMEIGGAERALLGLLETIDVTEYEVDLFLMRHSGELMKFIPKNINLLPELPQYSSLAIPFVSVLKKRQFGIAWGRYKGKKKAARFVHQFDLPAENDVALEYSHKYTLPYMPVISDQYYDLAISFLTPHYFVAEKVHARKKIAWIHTDYTYLAVDIESQLKMWNEYDWIASISEHVTESFLKIFPTLLSKILPIANIMPMEYMSKLAKKYTVEKEMPDDGAIKLLSIGRFCTAKNFDNIPFICKILREQGLNVKWYIIGFGADEALIRRKILDLRMQDYVIILGRKENPYPYIVACDLYVQPSRYEGKCVSVIEAQILSKPVVVTNYATSASQLKDEIDGIIVPMDNEGCAKGIANLLSQPSKMQRLSENCLKQDYTNSYEIKKIYQLIGD